MPLGKRVKVKNQPGISYRIDPERKDPRTGRPDKYWSIRYYFKVYDEEAGEERRVLKEEGIGWGTLGATMKMAKDRLRELKENHVTGKGPQTLKEQRKAEAQKRQEQEEAEAQRKLENITFGEVWPGYIDFQRVKGKADRTVKREESMYKVWLGPLFADTPLKDFKRGHLFEIKKRMEAKGRSPRSIQYACAIVRQVFTHAREEELFKGPNPVGKLRKADRNALMADPENKREEYLSKKQMRALLAELEQRSKTTYKLALISYLTGMRFGEIANLRVADVDLHKNEIWIRDSKNDQARYIKMHPRLVGLFQAMNLKGSKNALLFPVTRGARKGKVRQNPGATFYRVVKDLGFNNSDEKDAKTGEAKEITDRRKRICFHTLRHSAASHMASAGKSLAVIGDTLGHKLPKLTMRYSHINSDAQQDAINSIPDPFAPDPEPDDAKVIPFPNKERG